jgi:hypothetical protein
VSVSHRQPAARVGAAFVAAFVLLCQAAAWVHAAATPHVTCFEHGESVHLAAAPAADANEAADATARPAPAESTAHAHEHCGARTHRTTAAPVAAPAIAHTTFEAPAMPGVSRAPAATTLLLFAPKTSPPAAPTV